MADDNYALTFAKINQEARMPDTTATLKSAAMSALSADSAVAEPTLKADGGFAGLSLALADATAELRQLTAEQVQLRDALGSIHTVLMSQHSLQQALNDRQSQMGGAALGAGQKTPSENAATAPYKPLQPAINLDAAMARLNVVVGLEGDQRKTMQVALEKMATEAKVAAGGTTVVELASIGYAGAKAGVIKDRVDAKGNIDQAARQNDLLDFTRDTAVTATAFKMKPLDAADLLIGWRTSMSLDRAQTLDLADATSLLDSRLAASAADIGSILGTYGTSAKGAGMAPEQAAAFSAALLNAGVNKADAGVAFEKITTTLALGDKASASQKAAFAQLQLDPKALAEKMKGDAPGAIMEVLEALKKQSPNEQSALSTTLFSVAQPVRQMLENTADVQRAFALVAGKKDEKDKKEYTGAVDKTALTLADTSQARWNVFGAQKDRLYSSAGDTVLPVFDYLVEKVGEAADGLSEVAEKAPALAGALILMAAGLKGGKPLGALASQAATWTGPVMASIRSGLGSLSASAGSLGTAALSRAKFLVSAPGRSLISQGARFGRVAGPLSMPLTMVEAGMRVVEGVAEGDTKKVAGGVGMAAGGLAGGYAGASIGATIGTFILPGIGTMIGGALGGVIGSFYGSQEGEALGEKLATPAPDRLAPPSEVSAGLSSVQAQNQQNQNVTYAPAFNFSGGDLVSAEKVTAMVAQVMQSHFTSDFTPLMSTNPLGTRRDAALTDGVA
ncbi:phage tail tape measure protein [Pseudomonas sp. NPDC087598]|uniref:phage tail tape measure protein n=1 Tax=Pseudomonas sp. NPDC087598 TaxID=3364440 RepID=UPI0037F943B3